MNVAGIRSAAVLRCFIDLGPDVDPPDNTDILDVDGIPPVFMIVVEPALGIVAGNHQSVEFVVIERCNGIKSAAPLYLERSSICRCLNRFLVQLFMYVFPSGQIIVLKISDDEKNDADYQHDS